MWKTLRRDEKYTESLHVEVQPWHALTFPSYERTHDVRQLFTSIATHLRPPDSDILCALFEGVAHATVARTLQVSERSIYRSVHRSLDTLKAVLLHEGQRKKRVFHGSAGGGCLPCAPARAEAC